jgi:hypothetical protein
VREHPTDTGPSDDAYQTSLPFLLESTGQIIRFTEK